MRELVTFSLRQATSRPWNITDTGLNASTLSLIVFLGGAALTGIQPAAPGVQAARGTGDLPLPTQGVEAYLVGELHGLEENEVFQAEYLKRLYAESGVRDVAIEEDAVYEDAARAYVAHRSDSLPRSLCLRAGILSRIRRFNQELGRDAIRVHLVDIDSPAEDGANRTAPTTCRELPDARADPSAISLSFRWHCGWATLASKLYVDRQGRTARVR